MTKRHVEVPQTVILLILFFLLPLTGCDGALENEANWENGQGQLSEQIGSSVVNEEMFSPFEYYFNDYVDVIEKTEYDMPTSRWFMHNDEGKFGYGFPSGTMETGADYTIKLFAHNEVVPMNRDIRIQLTSRDQTYKQSELIMEDIIHVDEVTGEQEIYANRLPVEQNVVYVLSMEVLDQQQQVEDTMVSLMYVPIPELNAKITLDKEVYEQSENQATITIKNYGPTFLSIGEYYTIEKRVKDSWKVVPLDVEFQDIGILINPNDTYDQSIIIDQLTPAEYRVIKKINADGLNLSATLAAEFSVK